MPRHLLIVHHHFRPGGVRRIIELATPHLLLNKEGAFDGVALVSGEPIPPDWLLAFRQRLGGTPVRVMVCPAFGYASEWHDDDTALRCSVVEGLERLFAPYDASHCLVWAHNLSLGRNLHLTRELANQCDRASIPLMAHHHDWWFENRWHHYTGMRAMGYSRLDAIGRVVLPASPVIRHLAINRMDAAVLEREFSRAAGWLPNLVEQEAALSPGRLRFARSWLRGQLGEDAPVWLLPSRLLRRKNIAEALLLTRWLRPEAWLVTTGGVSSAEEQGYADALRAAARKRGWRLRLGLLEGDERQKPKVAELVAVSEAVMLTSLQEGFGLPYLESAAAGRPLIARQLPNIAPDLARFGFRFPQSYPEILVDPELFDWESERARQQSMFRAWKRLMPPGIQRFLGTPAVLAAQSRPLSIPFSRLTLSAQLEVLAQPPLRSWDRCQALNPFLSAWRRLAAARQLRTSPWPATASRWLSGPAYARRFFRYIPDANTPRDLSRHRRSSQSELLKLKLRSDYLYPILWSTQP